MYEGSREDCPFSCSQHLDLERLVCLNGPRLHNAKRVRDNFLPIRRREVDVILLAGFKLGECFGVDGSQRDNPPGGKAEKSLVLRASGGYDFQLDLPVRWVIGIVFFVGTSEFSSNCHSCLLR